MLSGLSHARVLFANFAEKGYYTSVQFPDLFSWISSDDFSIYPELFVPTNLSSITNWKC